MDLLLEKRQPVMLAGSAGVGKTALVRNKLDCLPESYMTTKVPFNYYTTSLMLQGESSASDCCVGGFDRSSKL